MIDQTFVISAIAMIFVGIAAFVSLGMMAVKNESTIVDMLMPKQKKPNAEANIYEEIAREKEMVENIAALTSEPKRKPEGRKQKVQVPEVWQNISKALRSGSQRYFGNIIGTYKSIVLRPVSKKKQKINEIDNQLEALISEAKGETIERKTKKEEKELSGLFKGLGVTIASMIKLGNKHEVNAIDEQLNDVLKESRAISEEPIKPVAKSNPFVAATKEEVMALLQTPPKEPTKEQKPIPIPQAKVTEDAIKIEKIDHIEAKSLMDQELMVKPNKAGSDLNALDDLDRISADIANKMAAAIINGPETTTETIVTAPPQAPHADDMSRFANVNDDLLSELEQTTKKESSVKLEIMRDLVGEEITCNELESELNDLLSDIHKRSEACKSIKKNKSRKTGRANVR